MIAPKQKSVGAYEAKTHLPALLKEVERGKEIIITRRDRPIARLIPIHTGDDKQFWDRILIRRGKMKLLKGETWKDFIDAGRRM